MNTKKTKKIVVLATGGTIAGVAPDAQRPDYYESAVLTADVLLASLPQSVEALQLLSGLDLSTEQIAQVDSKDMTHALWRTLAQRCAQLLDDPLIDGVVITHGTDTVEETAFFLHCVLRAQKPVALTCAMRPANAPDADGPANLLDALLWVAHTAQPQVAVVVHGQAHAATAVQKVWSHRCDAFSSGAHDPVALIQAGLVQETALTQGNLNTTEIQPAKPEPWPAPHVSALPEASDWPDVQLIFSHASADGALVRAAMQSGAHVRGWVVAATGAGTIHQSLVEALLQAQSNGAQIWRASRCAGGEVHADDGREFVAAQTLSPVKARIALMLSLMCQ